MIKKIMAIIMTILLVAGMGTLAFAASDDIVTLPDEESYEIYMGDIFGDGFDKIAIQRTNNNLAIEYYPNEELQEMYGKVESPITVELKGGEWNSSNTNVVLSFSSYTNPDFEVLVNGEVKDSSNASVSLEIGETSYYMPWMEMDIDGWALLHIYMPDEFDNPEMAIIGHFSEGALIRTKEIVDPEPTQITAPFAGVAVSGNGGYDVSIAGIADKELEEGVNVLEKDDFYGQTICVILHNKDTGEIEVKREHSLLSLEYTVKNGKLVSVHIEGAAKTVNGVRENYVTDISV